MNLCRLYLAFKDIEARWNLRTFGGKSKGRVETCSKIAWIFLTMDTRMCPILSSKHKYNLQANPMLHWISLDDPFEGNRVDPSVVNEVLELMGFTERLLGAGALIAKEVVCQCFSTVTHRREETYHPNFPPKNCQEFPL